jgi:hypothetical protein
VREGSREEKWYGTAGVPGYFRKPYGNGWALVGDASYNPDPITAQGISDVFIDAEYVIGEVESRADALFFGRFLRAGEGRFDGHGGVNGHDRAVC